MVPTRAQDDALTVQLVVGVAAGAQLSVATDLAAALVDSSSLLGELEEVGGWWLSWLVGG